MWSRSPGEWPPGAEIRLKQMDKERVPSKGTASVKAHGERCCDALGLNLEQRTQQQQVREGEGSRG